MFVRPISEELQQKAINELNEVPKRREEDIQNLKEWISKQPHLHVSIDDQDQLLLSFLRSCKFSLQQVKNKLEVYYTMRTMLPEFFADRNPFLPEIEDFFKRGIFAVLPESENPLEPRRFLINTKNSDTVLVSTMIKSILLVIDILTVEDDVYVINGQEVIVDLQNAPYSYVTQLTPKLLKTMVTFIQSAYAARYKGIYFINTPPFLHAIVSIFKAFLSEKIKKRVYFFSESNMKDLFVLVPRSVFPDEYGGSAGSMETLSSALKLNVENHSEWLREDAKNCSDESKRISSSDGDIYHLNGSFRKLEID